MKNPTNMNCHHLTDKPITYHPGVDDSFDCWASECGWSPQSLRQASEQAIRTRHEEAVIQHEWHRANGNQPDIFTLSLGSVDVIYTVETHKVVIRGYGWEIDHPPLDDFDGGGFYADFSWSRESLELTLNRMAPQQEKTLVMCQELAEELRDIVDYLWYDERRHYEESGEKRQGGHIFESLHRIKLWLDENLPEAACKRK
jgi:hypothetical protein